MLIDAQSPSIDYWGGFLAVSVPIQNKPSECSHNKVAKVVSRYQGQK